MEYRELSALKKLHNNPRTIKNADFDKLCVSIKNNPDYFEARPLILSDRTGELVIIAGNQRYEAAKHLGITSVPTYLLPGLSEEREREIIIRDNISNGDWDWDILANEWDNADLVDWGLDVWEEDEDIKEGAGSGIDSAKGSLVDKFIVPPFSILDTRQGYWQKRKKAWRDIIGDMGESRNDLLLCSPEIKYKDIYQRSRSHRESLGITFKEYLDKYVSDEEKDRESSKVLSAGVSLFDPVLIEVVAKWFAPGACNVFDCFAGDTQKGYVFSHLGHKFTGIELRPEQVEVNKKIISEAGFNAVYICDDGRNVSSHLPSNSQDFLFSCPPYFDLEVYSELENYASNQDTYEDFLEVLKVAFKGAIECLKEDRFAVIVLGDVRDKKTGFYYNFIDDTKRMFKEFGAPLYNELILIETAGSTALRASRYMDSRKVAKMHQNILVFYKGNPKNIKANFNKIEYSSEDLKPFIINDDAE